MDLTPAQRKFASLFTPLALTKRDEVEKTNGRFVHYTSADTAMRIIQTGHVWMRNAMTMNDFSEIAYGRNCLFPAYKDDAVGGRLRTFLDGIYPDFSKKLEALFNGWLPHFEQDTYITSLSEHESSEDLFGRLSMWRAYCPQNGVALVLKNTPFMEPTDALKAYSSPVSYLTPHQFAEEFGKIIDNLVANEAMVRNYSEAAILAAVFTMLKFALLCTKHPGFAEEREWRVIYSPTQERSPVIEPGFATLHGVPQQIYKIPLVDDPAHGLVHADIPNILDRLIIGPSPQPFTIWRAFVGLLREAGVPDPEQRVFVSDIPLRTG